MLLRTRWCLALSSCGEPHMVAKLAGGMPKGCALLALPHVIVTPAQAFLCELVCWRHEAPLSLACVTPWWPVTGLSCQGSPRCVGPKTEPRVPSCGGVMRWNRLRAAPGASTAGYPCLLRGGTHPCVRFVAAVARHRSRTRGRQPPAAAPACRSCLSALWLLARCAVWRSCRWQSRLPMQQYALQGVRQPPLLAAAASGGWPCRPVAQGRLPGRSPRPCAAASRGHNFPPAAECKIGFSSCWHEATRCGTQHRTCNACLRRRSSQRQGTRLNVHWHIVICD